MRLLVLLLGAVAMAVAGEEEKERNKREPLLQIDPGLNLPQSAHGLPDKGGWRVIVNLDASGKLSVGDRHCTLAEFGKVLAAQVKDHEEIVDGASTMRVLLRMDRDAPWLHAQWLMIECAQQKVARVEWAVRLAGDKPGYLKCWLPKDVGPDVRQSMRVRVHVVARAEKPAAFGEFTVTKPTQFIYRIGEEQLKKTGEVGAAIAKLKGKARTAKLTTESEIRAGYKVPFGTIVAVLDQYRANKITDVQFYGAQAPTTQQRAAKRLDYPKKNYSTR